MSDPLSARDRMARRMFEELEIDLPVAYEAVDICFEEIRGVVETELRRRGKVFFPRLGFFTRNLSRETLVDVRGKIFFRPSSQVTEFESY